MILNLVSTYALLLIFTFYLFIKEPFIFLSWPCNIYLYSTHTYPVLPQHYNPRLPGNVGIIKSGLWTAEVLRESWLCDTFHMVGLNRIIALYCRILEMRTWASGLHIDKLQLTSFQLHEFCLPTLVKLIHIVWPNSCHQRYLYNYILQRYFVI